MRKITSLVLIVCLIFSLAMPASATVSEESTVASTQSQPPQNVIIPEVAGNASVNAGCCTLDAKVPLLNNQQMLETAKSAILYETNTGTLIYTWNPDKRIYPGGLGKLMTVLVALEQGNLEDTVTVSRSTLNVLPVGTVVCGLTAGEEISLKDLLYCVMVASANDAAVVVAQHISGSQEAFVEELNKKAQQIGCTDTHFANATGLHDELEYTTARDLGKILMAGFENELFKEMFNTAEYTVPATNQSDARVLNTTNYMMSKATLSRYFDARVTGGKTGASEEGGRSLAATAESGGMSLLSIVIDAVPIVDTDGISLSYYGNFEETKILFDYGFQNYKSFNLLYEDQAVQQFPVTDGANSVVGRPVMALGVTLPADVDTDEFTWRYDVDSGTLTAPISTGDHIGTAQIWYRAVCIGQVDLVAMTAVAKKTAAVNPGNQDDPGDDSGFSFGTVLMVLGIIFGVILVFFVMLLVIRLIRIAMIQTKRRRRRRNRRRSR